MARLDYLDGTNLSLIFEESQYSLCSAGCAMNHWHINLTERSILS